MAATGALNEQLESVQKQLTSMIEKGGREREVFEERASKLRTLVRKYKDETETSQAEKEKLEAKLAIVNTEKEALSTMCTSFTLEKNVIERENAELKQKMADLEKSKIKDRKGRKRSASEESAGSKRLKVDEEEEEQLDSTNEDETVDCICGETENDGEAMVGCDRCTRFEHIECVFPRSKEAPSGGYVCHTCKPRPTELTPRMARKHQNEVRRKRRKDHEFEMRRREKEWKAKEKEEAIEKAKVMKELENVKETNASLLHENMSTSRKIAETISQKAKLMDDVNVMNAQLRTALAEKSAESRDCEKMKQLERQLEVVRKELTESIKEREAANSKIANLRRLALKYKNEADNSSHPMAAARDSSIDQSVAATVQSMTSKIVEGEEEMDDRLKVIKQEKEEVENERDRLKSRESSLISMVQRAYGTLSRGQEELKKELTALGVEELEASTTVHVAASSVYPSPHIESAI